MWMKSLLSKIMRLIKIAVPPQLGNMGGQHITVLADDADVQLELMVLSYKQQADQIVSV